MASFDKIIPETKKQEGGLSRAKTDSASAYPSGCEITYKGVTASDWHTNKGVTWQTFSGNASKLSYDASCKNFEAMPEEIWGKIAKKLIWDPYLLDEYRSQAIANFIFQWAWGSGIGGSYRQLSKFANDKYSLGLSGSYSLENARKLKDKFNQVSVSNEGKLLFELKEALKGYYKSLNQPANEAGWLRRVDELYQVSLQQVTDIGKFTKAHFGKVMIGAALVGATIYAIVKFSKSK